MTLNIFRCDTRVIYRVVIGVFRENLIHISRVLYITIPCVNLSPSLSCLDYCFSSIELNFRITSLMSAPVDDVRLLRILLSIAWMG